MRNNLRAGMRVTDTQRANVTSDQFPPLSTPVYNNSEATRKIVQWHHVGTSTG